ncbi:hypothetical protein [Pararhodobacter sp. SW119]|nr:hypothetical protein [Pararhodobacter sp. SW119]
MGHHRADAMAEAPRDLVGDARISDNLRAETPLLEAKISQMALSH